MIPVGMTASSAPKSAYTHGNLLHLQKITQDLSIQTILENFLNEVETDTVITLAYNRVVRPMAMCNVQTWMKVHHSG